MTHHNDCIFCKIINGEIPATKIYEDDDVLAFLDISQVTKGHTLIVPKKHVANIYETSKDTASVVFGQVPKVSRAINEAFKPKGMNILNNCGPFAGQSVFHLHIHLIPRYDQSDGCNFEWHVENGRYSQEKLQSFALDIKKFL